jgi:Hom_end-associated Hint/Homing endonuclease
VNNRNNKINKMTDTCSICVDTFNNSVRKKVTCSNCNIDICTKCIKKFLAENVQEPNCMSCKEVYTKAFMDRNFSYTYRKTVLKNVRLNVLVAREKQIMPELMHRANAYKQLKDYELKRRELRKQIDALEVKLEQVYTSRGRLDQLLNNNVVNIGTVDTKLSDEFMKSITDSIINTSKVQGDLETELDNLEISYEENWENIVQLNNTYRYGGIQKIKTVMNCLRTDCKGFLDNDYKCGICHIKVCKDCHEELIEDESHNCKEENIESVKAIQNETRPCPTCKTRVFKTEGCFAKDTPILLWNGTTKMSQDIEIGDVLVGDDGEQRKVLNTLCGVDNMYKVEQNCGMSYIVNSKHKLVLRFSGDRTIFWKESDKAWEMKWFDHNDLKIKTKKIKTSESVSKSTALEQMECIKSSIKFPYEIEIVVDDYMKLPDYYKKHLCGFKAPFINWQKKDIHIDPYLLGLWLGDGINIGTAFAANDKDIIEYILAWCERNDAELVHDAAYKFRVRRKCYTFGSKAIGHGASCDTCKGCQEKKNEICDMPLISYGIDTNDRLNMTNPLKSQLDKYNLIKNKHIPFVFIVNDRETRLKVLAGIVDTDGYLTKDKKRIQIPQTNHKLAQQIAFLARSLGFVVGISLRKKKNVLVPNTNEVKDYKDQLLLNISGNLFEIPTILPRKQAQQCNATNCGLVTGISVTHIGKDNYYGWQVDNNKRFLLPDMTVSRNCDQMFCVQCHTGFSWNTGMIERGRIHNPHYFEWLRSKRREMPREIGDIPCGGLPSWFMIKRHLNELDIHFTITTYLSSVYKMTEYLQEKEIPKYPVTEGRDEELNIIAIDYMADLISLNQWRNKLFQIERKKEVNRERRLILDMVLAVLIDLFGDIYNLKNKDALVEKINEFDELRKYFNVSIKNLGNRFDLYNFKVIDETWQSWVY